MIGVEQGSDANSCSPHTAEINRNSTKYDILKSEISPQEVTEAIHHLKENKTAGRDGVNSEVYKHAGDKTIPLHYLHI